MIILYEGFTQGRLKIIKQLPKLKTDRYTKYLCRCYCGNSVIYDGCAITHKIYPRKSCNKCYDAQKYHEEYHIWESMKDRCYNTKRERYPEYGGRGIILCDRWKKDFLFFLEDMGLRPTNSHTIERNDVHGNYEKSNCRWVLSYFQQANTQQSIINRI